MNKKNQTHFFSFTQSYALKFANYLKNKKVALNKFSYLVIGTGVLAPLPLVIGLFGLESYFRVLAGLLLCLFVFLDYSLFHLEVISEKRSPLTILMPGQISFFVLFWFEIILCEVVRSHLGFKFLLYYNVFALGCAMVGFFLVYGYLKLNEKPLSITVFNRELEKLADEAERQLHINYMGLFLGLVKRDLIALVILISSFLNIYLVYLLMTLAPMVILGVIIYSMILLKWGSSKS